MKELYNALPLPNDSPVTAIAVTDDIGNICHQDIKHYIFELNLIYIVIRKMPTRLLNGG